MNDDARDPTPSADPGGARYSIGELADAGGVSRRAVRFYVQRGLIAPPLGGGRGAHYDDSHLAQLLAIKRRQEAGEPLGAIARAFEADPPEPVPTPASEPWSRLSLAPGVELHLRREALTAAQEAAFIQILGTALTLITSKGELE